MLHFGRRRSSVTRGRSFQPHRLLSRKYLLVNPPSNPFQSFTPSRGFLPRTSHHYKTLRHKCNAPGRLRETFRTIHNNGFSRPERHRNDRTVRRWLRSRAAIQLERPRSNGQEKEGDPSSLAFSPGDGWAPDAAVMAPELVPRVVHICVMRTLLSGVLGFPTHDTMTP